MARADLTLPRPPPMAEWCALVWYVASYIPYGQKMIKMVVGKATEF